MIVIQLLGRLGNCMFLFGLGISLQKLYPDNEVLFYYSKSYPEDTRIVCEKYIKIFKDEFNFKFIDDPVPEMQTLDKDEFEHLSEIPIKENIFLRSFFQSYKFLDKNSCQDRLKCPIFIKKEIEKNYGNISDFVSMHVRRGDYLNSGYFISMGKEWYLKCINLFPKNQKFIVTSDDLEWCKSNFTNNNITYADKETKNSELIDMYIHSLCRDNIISASTFSWWGAYLNSNANKKIYVPNKWTAGPDLPRYYTDEMIRI